MTPLNVTQMAQTRAPASEPTSPVREAALKLEASFLAEMLKAAGVGDPPAGFSGGAGEDHFASFQRTALAEKLTQSGGIGLARAFEAALMEAAT